MFEIVARRQRSGKKQYTVYSKGRIVFITHLSTNLKYYIEHNEKIKNGSDSTS